MEIWFSCCFYFIFITFEAFSAGLLKEVLLPAIVGNVPGVVLYDPESVDAELPNQAKRSLI